METIHNDPDGVNINVASGATAPASLAAEVKARGADVGFALDGDADRLIAVDATGEVVDGDQVLGLLALDRIERGVLPEGALVVSVLSNGGLRTAVEAAGGQIIRTPVGDKYILEGMQVSGAGLGGEKSGHVIILEHTTSGDGIVTGARGPPGDDPGGAAAPRARRPGAAAAPAAARGEGPPQGPVGGRSARSSGRSATRRRASVRAAASSSGRPARSPPCG